jgi:hypothetical protein
MTSLHVFILSTIQRLGPQTEYALWHSSKCQSLTAIIMATIELEADKLIERTSAGTPLSTTICWGITEKGRQLVAGKKEQEVLA